ncbi:MAG TPA: DUF3460 family protein [Casimicrobiaceae bacterium]|nr:DUF3460 family protein [Casimicrobiaceae bacterium]
MIAMPMLPARHYVSDATRFLRELAEKRGDIDEQQRKARAIWWDKDPKDLVAEREMAKSRVPMQPYVYSNE